MTDDLYRERPQLSCRDPYIQNFFNYRWENLRRMTFDFTAVSPHLPHQAVYEGPSFFSRHITYSAFAHMMELRWLHDPTLAQGSLLNFVANQSDDGSFPGHIGPPDDPRFVGPHKESFYHADWGRAIIALHQIHPSYKFFEEIYPALVRYAEYFERERDRENSGLFDVVNQFETGQEFTPRYTAVCPNADTQKWGIVFRLKGVDAAVYMHNLYSALQFIARA